VVEVIKIVGIPGPADQGLFAISKPGTDAASSTLRVIPGRQPEPAEASHGAVGDEYWLKCTRHFAALVEENGSSNRGIARLASQARFMAQERILVRRRGRRRGGVPDVRQLDAYRPLFESP